MAIDLNFSGVERPKQGGFLPVPEADYDLVVSDFKIKPAQTDPNKQVAHCVFEITSGEYEGRRLLHFQGLTGDQTPYAKVMLEAIYGQELDGEFELDEEDVIGRNFEAHVGVRPDNRDPDRKQNRISYFILPFKTEDEPF
jgi:hypothetical protein